MPNSNMLKSVFVIAMMAAALIVAARAQVWIMSPSGGGRAISTQNSGPPPTCAGAIDLSTGCGTPQIGIR